MIDTKFEVTAEVLKFLAAHKAHESVSSVKVSQDADGEKRGEISEALAATLSKTKALFVSEAYAEARIAETEERIRARVEAILEEIATKAPDHLQKKAARMVEVTVRSRFFDRYIGEDNASITISFRGIGEADDLIDDSDFEHEALYYRGARDGLSDAVVSYDWAAWLGDENSPFHSDDFVEGYAKDQASQALEQFSQTLNESTFDDDIRRDLTTRVAHLANELGYP